LSCPEFNSQTLSYLLLLEDVPENGVPGLK